MTNRENAVLPVNGLPLQAADFALPHARAKRQQDHLEHHSLGVRQKSFALVHGEKVGLGGCEFEGLHLRRGAMQPVPFPSRGKALPENGKLVVDCLIASASAALSELVALYIIGRNAV